MPDWSSPEFEWDDQNATHIIERYDFYPEEAEQVFYNGPHVRRGNDVYYAYGRDDAGRYRFVVIVIRGPRVRVVSARTMTLSERRLYERHR
ncbi:MAG: BrnT family toxin [Chloroflexota bacterium]|nr:BrnT family toxin [Chloroflexota bacterium]